MTAFILRLLAMFTLAAALGVSAQPYIAGQTYFGHKNYIEFRAGDLPLIITSSHGGKLSPEDIPDRTYGVKIPDANTVELSIACAEAITKLTGGRRPHLVLTHLRRSKLDANRPLIEAAQGDPQAVTAWQEFHGFITSARRNIDDNYGRGLLVDIHGHAHDVQRLELGYNLGPAQLNIPDSQLDQPRFVNRSSLRTLSLSHPKVPFSQLVRGQHSLGDLFNTAGFPAWPSPQFPRPDAEPFYSGGYITLEHSCARDDLPVNAVQIEANFRGVRDTPAARAAFAQAFARVIDDFYARYYGRRLSAFPLPAKPMRAIPAKTDSAP
jgi:hypothetical protein